MANLDKYLTPEGAEALRTFAASMPCAIENISEATEKMDRTYSSVMESLGTHGEDFREILEHVKSAKTKAAEALEYLPPELEKTATKIDAYVAKKIRSNIEEIINPTSARRHSFDVGKLVKKRVDFSTSTRISPDEQKVRWKTTIKNTDELIQYYREGLISNGVSDCYLLTKFLANHRTKILQYEAELLNVASGNRPPLEENEIYNYVVVGENSTYNFSHLKNDFSDFCLNEINSWIGQINYNPNNDPRRSVNCGKCAVAVFLRLNGDNNAVAGLGTYSIDEMNSITGFTQTAMTPAQIENHLRSQGAGSHVVVGVDRASGAGHWFNAFFDGRKVYTIESQGGYIDGWPPDYGNVVYWDASI